MSIQATVTNFPLGPFEKYEGNPILRPHGSSWQAKDLFNPTAIVKDDLIYLLYRAEDHDGPGQWNGTSRIGLAVSRDGIHFETYPDPVLYPTEPYEFPGGCEDPRIVQVGDTYYLTYTAFDGYSAYLCLATSDNLVEWRKHGVLFPDWRGDSDRVWSKSGAIVPEQVGGRYVMYFGDTSVWLAYSDDLIHWVPDPEPVFSPSPDPAAFDSALVEPGPRPIMTDEGILLIYNAARRVVEHDDPAFGKLRYSPGQILFDREDPRRVVYRSTEPFLTPDAPDEISGQVDHTIFVEGLVNYQGKDFLYFGMADSRVGVAVREHPTGSQWR